MATRNEIDIKWQDLFKTIEGLKTNVYNHILIEREIVPIIFVPGIMGSRLKNSEGKVVWDPDAKLFMVFNYGRFGVDAEDRKRRLVGSKFTDNHLQVSNDDAEHNKKFEDENDPTRADRGWGGVLWSSYGKLIRTLQRNNWEEPLNLCFEFPVYAFGYNWTDSNYNAGEKLKNYIAKVKKEYTDEKNRKCKYVILVTHSMGGLVARSACKLHGAENDVLGVIHGAQPVTGAPTAYWRMKAGFERPHGGPNNNLWDWFRNPVKMASHKLVNTIAAQTLGTNGEEVTSILANIPGGLELLPNKHYKDNKGNTAWLHVPLKDGSVKSFPQSGDPYKEIYQEKQSVFWRLVNPAWLEPSPNTTATATSADGRGSFNTSWTEYEKCLEEAEYFHKELGLNHHSNTYQFYASGIDTIDRIEFTRDECQYNPLFSASPKRRGAYTEYVNECNEVVSSPEAVKKYDLIEMSSSKNWKGGDGTVSESAGTALNLPEDNTVELDSKQGSAWFDNGHQDVFKTDKAVKLAFIGAKNFAKQRIKKETATQ